MLIEVAKMDVLVFENKAVYHHPVVIFGMQTDGNLKQGFPPSTDVLKMKEAEADEDLVACEFCFSAPTLTPQKLAEDKADIETRIKILLDGVRNYSLNL